MKVYGENNDRGWTILKMTLKQPKLKVIIHVFRLSRGLGSERHGMAPRDLGGH